MSWPRGDLLFWEGSQCVGGESGEGEGSERGGKRNDQIIFLKNAHT